MADDVKKAKRARRDARRNNAPRKEIDRLAKELRRAKRKRRSSG